MKKTILTTTIAFLLGMGIQQNAHADLKDGLVAHWSFDDCRATDNSRNGHDGTLNGNPQCVDGVKGKAFSFDGVSDYINAGNSPLFNVNNHTITTWIKSSGEGTGVIVGKVNPYVYETINLVLNGKNSKLHTSFATDYEVNHGLESVKTIADNQWHFVVMTYDGASVNFYIDGILDSSYPRTGTVRINDNELAIGRHGGASRGNDAFLNGSLDDLRIYNRALTEAEVMELYNGGGVVAEKPVLVADTGTTGVCSKTSALMIGGIDLGGVNSAAGNCTASATPPATETPESIYGWIEQASEKITENRMDEAMSSVAEMLGYLSAHPYFKNTSIAKIGLNGKLSRTVLDKLDHSIREKLDPTKIDVKKMGMEVIADLFIDEIEEAISSATGSKYWGGAAWFIMKQAYALGNVAVDSKEMPLPIAFLKNQSVLLAAVVQRDIKEFGILKKDALNATASEIRSRILSERSNGRLTVMYQEYFRAESTQDKNNIRKKIVIKQKEFLSRYLDESGYSFLSSDKKDVALQVYSDWVKDLPYRLVKDEFTARANLSALVYLDKDYEAKKVSKAFFGLEIYALDLIAADNKQKAVKP